MGKVKKEGVIRIFDIHYRDADGEKRRLSVFIGDAKAKPAKPDPLPLFNAWLPMSKGTE